MYILETFDKELYEKDLKEDAFEEGMKEGMLLTYLELIKDGIITIPEVAKRLQISESDIKDLMEK